MVLIRTGTSVREWSMLLLLLLSRFSRVRLFMTPWTAAYQAPPSLGFCRQEYWSGCHCLLHLYSWLYTKMLALNYHGQEKKENVSILIQKYDSFWLWPWLLLSIWPQNVLTFNYYACFNTGPWFMNNSDSFIQEICWESLMSDTRDPRMYQTQSLLSRNL